MTSIALLVLGVTAMVAAGNAWRPVRTWWAAVISWPVSVYCTELAPQLMVLSVLAATVLASFGGLKEPEGWFGLAAVLVGNVGAFIVLLRFWRNAVSLDPPLGQPDLPATSRYPRSHCVFPFLVWRRAGVRRRRGIVYARPGGVDLKLDVYAPREPDTIRPAVVYVHGGGLMSGSRRHGKPLLTHLAANGWVAFSIDYRLSPRATFPEHL